MNPVRTFPSFASSELFLDSCGQELFSFRWSNSSFPFCLAVSFLPTYFSPFFLPPSLSLSLSFSTRSRGSLFVSPYHRLGSSSQQTDLSVLFLPFTSLPTRTAFYHVPSLLSRTLLDLPSVAFCTFRRQRRRRRRRWRRRRRRRSLRRARLHGWCTERGLWKFSQRR